MVARLSRAFESAQPILHAILEQLAAKASEQPTPPAWRER